LRHISRTSLLLHVVDAARITPQDPLADWLNVNRELEMFDAALARKPQILVANKIDLRAARENVNVLKLSLVSRPVPFCAVSAVSGEGVSELRTLIERMLQKEKRSGRNLVAAGL
jgi:GTP-binding protein